MGNSQVTVNTIKGIKNKNRLSKTNLQKTTIVKVQNVFGTWRNSTQSARNVINQNENSHDEKWIARHVLKVKRKRKTYF